MWTFVKLKQLSEPSQHLTKICIYLGCLNIIVALIALPFEEGFL